MWVSAWQALQQFNALVGNFTFKAEINLISDSMEGRKNKEEDWQCIYNK